MAAYRVTECDPLCASYIIAVADLAELSKKVVMEF